MKKLYFYPIAALLMFSVIIVSTTALLSSAVTVWMTSVISGDATAINVSGSLRMQAYRMANALAQNDVDALPEYQKKFEQSLFSAELAGHIPVQEQTLQNALGLVVEEWQQAEVHLQKADLEYLLQVDDFVTTIDQLVVLIELWSEEKVARLRQLQWLIGVISLLIAATLVGIVLKRLIQPLQLILKAVGDVAKGKLATKIDYQSADEFGVLASSFNHMAEQIANNSLSQAEIIATQTEQLSKNYEALSFLFELSQQLSTNQPILLEIQDYCVSRIPAIISACDIHWQNDQCLASARTVSVSSGSWYLCAEFNDPCERWQEQVLQTVVELFDQAEQRLQSVRSQSRLALLDERAVIARELHDSLAQSLSYLKIQVVRWTKMRERGAADNELDAVVQELRDGLNSSYRKLRELLVTFRSQMQEPGLVPALNGLLNEVGKLSPHLAVHLKIAADWPESLTPSQEIHCMHIIREALTNVVKHANATTVAISLYRKAQQLNIKLCDDGIGFVVGDKPMHYGLQIMQERALKIAGTIDYSTSPEGGACVLLTFPEYFVEEEN